MRLLVDLRPLRSSPAFRRLWIGTAFSAVGGQLAVVAVLYQAAAPGDAPRPDGATARPGVRAIWAGWRFIGDRPVLGGAFLADVLATVPAMPIALFPVVNEERFGGARRGSACSSPRSRSRSAGSPRGRRPGRSPGRAGPVRRRRCGSC